MKKKGHHYPYYKIGLSIDICNNFKKEKELFIIIKNLISNFNSMENIVSQIKKIGLNIYTEIQPLLRNIQPFTLDKYIEYSDIKEKIRNI